MSLPDGVSRRAFLKSAVAAGTASALSACLNATEEPVPEGVEDQSTLPRRQHAWNDRLRRDEHGNVDLPHHHVFLNLTLERDGPPADEDRTVVGSALETLDRAYERSNEGLVYSIGYSPAYFERFEASLPDSVDLPPPRRLSPFETPTFDEQDALVHLASDRPDVVVEADRVLRGERELANGIEAETALTDALTVEDRRTGFIGDGMPAERQDVAGIPDGKPVPEDAPLFMGFVAGFARNQATEDYVTIDVGPFAGATTKHVSTIRQRLQDWYVEQDFDERVMEMFSPTHVTEDLVDGAGHNLGDFSEVDEGVMAAAEDNAREFGRVGHAQKAARANRDEAGNVKLLRRHVESTDDDVASLHFPSLQRRISDFEAVREAMNGSDLTDAPAIRQRVNNGILEYIFVKRRGNWLVPPRGLRTLPPARPDA